jgi:hypothetical protein
MKFTMAATAFALFTGGGASFAATTVHGNLQGIQAWSAAAGAYVVDGDLAVVPGARLTLQGGVDVEVQPTDILAAGSDPNRVEIDVSGMLVTNATAGAPITIGPASGGAASTWTGLVIQNGGTWQSSPGLEIKGNVTLSSGSTFSGDGVDVDGNLRLGGSLAGGLPTSPVAAGTSVTLFDLAANDTVTGTFAGLPEGARFTQGGNEFAISYRGGDGNDVVVTAVPEPAAGTLAAFGLTGLLFGTWRARRRA